VLDTGKTIVAEKRMFGKSVIETDSFLDLPLTTKAIYFLLGMEADDEGFVSPKRVLRLYGGSDDDIKVLIAKNLVISFESGVVVITDWNENNYLDKNRIKPTRYEIEKSKLLLTSKRTYELNNGSTYVQPVESRVGENRVGESRIEKKLLFGELKNVKLKEEEYKKLVERFGEGETNEMIFELGTYMASKGKRYNSHYATILNWLKRKSDSKKEEPKSSAYQVEDLRKS